MRDWHEWYRQYEDPTSSLAQRLDVVRRQLGEALDRPKRVKQWLLDRGFARLTS